ncbi:phytoene desaturase family protein [Leifsonia soli]|uniref:Phytoene dehydrogenase-like protein n=1 Tax=Leifsonia soli TaxID=582665 RepID=A0A852T094_9MICO|nr:phytoene dehydrogenase-like protein [Leifsonia soli]
MTQLDAVVVGSGPNGLAAAVTLARAGLSVELFERNATIGGGMRTSELTLPGFHHDVCSAVHPLALTSPFFRRFQLERRVRFHVPELSYAHPLDGGRAGLAFRDLDRTVDLLGVDGGRWRSLFAPLVEEVDALARISGSSPLRMPRHPVTAFRLAERLLWQGGPAWNAGFRDEMAPAMLTGVFAHSTLSLPRLAAAATGLVLATDAHARGWPIPAGGSQAIADALAADFEANGGRIVLGAEIRSLGDLPSARAYMFDVSARGLARIAGDALPGRYRARLERFRHGNGIAKVDFALSDPVPWADPEVRRAGTVHLGGRRSAVARSENAVARGRLDDRPYVLVSQPSAFDPSRAPAGRHVLWAYTHVPARSPADRTEAVVAQIERFAPGFKDTILATASRTADDIERYNPNYVGGDIATGKAGLLQLVRRPVVSLDPWRTPSAGIYLCSASASPGPGVHGLGGWHAALSALRHTFGITSTPSLAP